MKDYGTGSRARPRLSLVLASGGSQVEGSEASSQSGATTMNAEEIPNWVPATVKKLAVGCLGSTDDLVRRLVTDPKMKSVWQYLRRAQPMDSEIANSKTIQEFLRVSETPISVQEQTCAVFFLSVVNELCTPRAATTRQDIENLVAPWRSAAEQCRSAIGCLSSSANPELVKALSLTAEYFEFEGCRLPMQITPTRSNDAVESRKIILSEAGSEPWPG